MYLVSPGGVGVIRNTHKKRESRSVGKNMPKRRHSPKKAKKSSTTPTFGFYWGTPQRGVLNNKTQVWPKRIP